MHTQDDFDNLAVERELEEMVFGEDAICYHLEIVQDFRKVFKFLHKGSFVGGADTAVTCSECGERFKIEVDRIPTDDQPLDLVQ